MKWRHWTEQPQDKEWIVEWHEPVDFMYDGKMIYEPCKLYQRQYNRFSDEAWKNIVDSPKLSGCLYWIPVDEIPMPLPEVAK